MQRAWKRRGEGGTFLGAPKTKKSRRALVLTPDQVQLFQRRCLGKNPSDLIFTAPEGGAWHSGVFHAHRWKPALDAANLAGLTKRPRMHDLRHTHASWLIAGKVPLPVIQARPGHESITTTVDRYGRLLESSDAEVVAAVEWAMNPPKPLPHFPKQSGLASTMGGLPQVPRQGSALAQTTWKDANDVPLEPTDQGDGPVFVVTLGGREVPHPMGSRWTWEFEPDGFTMRAAGFGTEFRPHGNTEAPARGITRSAVIRAFEQARAEALEVCVTSPRLRPDGSPA
ncbi:site-specific integrase [Streptomyces lydicus]|uniref:site-specific integrase n=1 Tax=Streptomyces lydicus TaxID=47763 RepID=UPI0036780C85